MHQATLEAIPAPPKRRRARAQRVRRCAVPACQRFTLQAQCDQHREQLTDDANAAPMRRERAA